MKFKKLLFSFIILLFSLNNYSCPKIKGILIDAEISDVFKKKLAYNKDIDWVNVKEEIGDLMWYISNFCNLNNWDLREILNTNIQKLKIRFPEKFEENQAINRNLEQERKTLEK